MFPISEQLLTEILTRSGRLAAGEVASIAQAATSHQTVMSTLFAVEIRYSPDAEGDPPDRCLVKLAGPTEFQMGRSEMEFYRFASASDAVVECYGTHIDEDAPTAVILLEERHGPFVRTEWPIPHDFPSCARAIDTLGRFHATWWDSSEARRIGQHRQLPQADPERLAPRMRALFDKLSDALSPPRRNLLEHLVARYPELHAARLRASDRQTIVHGDAHLWNFLIPADVDRPPAIVDWQLWGVDYGAADLAYMIGLHWFPERRARFERDLVHTWTTALQARGIEYPFDEAWLDYRFLMAGLLPRVVVYSAVLPANIWWPHLERAYLAFEDLDCAEFFM